jgi:DNA-directed RNA polymerase subunit RPC12/RpoP
MPQLKFKVRCPFCKDSFVPGNDLPYYKCKKCGMRIVVNTRTTGVTF